MNPLKGQGQIQEIKTPNEDVKKSEKGKKDNLSHYISPEKSESSPSLYRHVFTHNRTEFKAFLETIFYQLDTKKVFALVDDILMDHTKTDEQIYEDLLKRIHLTKKRFAPFFEAFKALPILRTGMGKQTAEHMKDFEGEKFKSYLEISTRRYVKGIEKEAQLSFKNVSAVSDETSINLVKRFEAGSLSYPYRNLINLNDEDCNDYYIETDKTFKPLGKEIANKSQDMVVCLGGLHHIPKERIKPFIQSVHDKLKPGAVLLLRDHNAQTEDVKALASVVHSFVNAVDGLSLEGEQAEIRNFQGEHYWKKILEENGFEQVGMKSLVLKDDPTENAMTMFVKTPKTKEEIDEGASYLKKYQRSAIGSYATWVEWGNVRFEKQYAEFIQNHHSYAFDFIGHIRQHWAHFYNTVKCSLKQPGVSIKDLLFSDNTAMNLFILFGTTADLGLRALTSLPSALIARARFGEKWRDVVNLSALEKFEARFKEDYSKFIDYDPFFKYPYFKAIREMWSSIYQSEDSFFTKVGDVPGALVFSATVGVQGLLSLFINSVYYTSDESSDLETIHYVLDDPNNELDEVIKQWNEQKMSIEFNGKKPFERCDIKVIYNVDGRKLVSIPYYKPFTEITKMIAQTDIQLVKVGGQEKITVDLCLNKDEPNPEIEGAKFIYTLDRLQDKLERRYVTYEVEIARLSVFCRNPAVKNHIEYIHVHR